MITIQLRHPFKGSTGSLQVEPLGGTLHRVAEIPSALFGDPFECGDVIDVVTAADGVCELREVRERGNWRRFDFLVTRAHAESPELARVLDRVVGAGGQWVRDAGGVLSIVLPPDSTWDPNDDVHGCAP